MDVDLISCSLLRAEILTYYVTIFLWVIVKEKISQLYLITVEDLETAMWRTLMVSNQEHEACLEEHKENIDVHRQWRKANSYPSSLHGVPRAAQDTIATVPVQEPMTASKWDRGNRSEEGRA